MYLPSFTIPTPVHNPNPHHQNLFLSILNNSLKQVTLKMCDYDSFLDMDLFNSPTFITIFELSFEDVKKLTESEFRNKLIHLKSGIKISM